MRKLSHVAYCRIKASGTATTKSGCSRINGRARPSVPVADRRVSRHEILNWTDHARRDNLPGEQGSMPATWHFSRIAGEKVGVQVTRQRPCAKMPQHENGLFLTELGY
ncbi:hypothetical protein [Martelella soudanensis]|uniref:hypothetical protein n=1 Tax=unclassified Martelella TaxID=2629616 RepID=UPI0015DFA46C|nr:MULTISPECIES: hypothetical protein [unclassified Martelella]